MIGVYLLLVITFYMEKYLPCRVNHFFSLIAYASMFAYLFHREGYTVFPHFEKMASIELPDIILPLLTIIIFVVSYYLQKAYDHIMKKNS